ncbi:hypothetical protein I3760_02G007300 [Carya illinoinensis]|nr:hypothetical protein I3760_02G007300 [Carya illinoinensis]
MSRLHSPLSRESPVSKWKASCFPPHTTRHSTTQPTLYYFALNAPSSNVRHSNMLSRMILLLQLSLLLLTVLSVLIFSGHVLAAPSTTSPAAESLLLPSDAVSLLSFKSKADLDNRLLYTLNERFDYCQWQGVKCTQGRVVRFGLQGFGLRGVLPPNTLTRLDQLRVLILRNNSLFGPIPDLSGLFNLKSLILDRNYFSGSFPASVLLLHRLRVLELSHNNLTGPIPASLCILERLSSLRLESNRFNGTVPPLNQSYLQILNVSENNLEGPIPVTPTLSRFDAKSFQSNLRLCGKIINKVCNDSHSPFFESPTNAPLNQSAQSQEVVVLSPTSNSRKHKSIALVLGSLIGVSVLIASLLCVFGLVKKKSSHEKDPPKKTTESLGSEPGYTPNPPTEARPEEISDLPKTFIPEVRAVRKSGNLVFCGGQGQPYNLEQLMRASAELLGRGTVGTTYKAVLDNQLIVTVKRLDANKTAITSSQMFEHHMDAVGGLRHPNLVPMGAYFQAKGERLVIYEYQPNGSLFNLIHGSKSTRAKPLHWTSCLKIAEDVAQGLTYIHQASRLIHGNLKSSNVLLGADFEACVTDYCLAVLADSSSNENPDSAAYKAPETRRSSSQATFKSDVFAFGILLLELLTGKHPSQHPFLVPTEVPDWVRAMREDDGCEDSRLGMLTEVACVCTLTSPEQRPAMWQVLKTILEIKERVVVENASVGFS